MLHVTLDLRVVEGGEVRGSIAVGEEVLRLLLRLPDARDGLVGEVGVLGERADAEVDLARIGVGFVRCSELEDAVRKETWMSDRIRSNPIMFRTYLEELMAPPATSLRKCCTSVEPTAAGISSEDLDRDSRTRSSAIEEGELLRM